MDANIGSTISIQDDMRQAPVDSRLVGFEASNYVIVRLPASPKGEVFKIGQSVTARYVHAGVAHRFNATILFEAPEFHLIFLSYPLAYDSQPLRRETRVNCSIPATANIERRAFKGLITDISNHGCQFIVKIPSSFKLYRVSVLTDIHLSLSLFGPGDAAKVRGKVRNTNVDELKIVLGIEFERLEEELSQKLKGFIEELVVLDPASDASDLGPY